MNYVDSFECKCGVCLMKQQNEGEPSVSEDRALRFEKGKPPLSWLDPGFLKEMAMVLYAASQPAGGKYPVDNWRKGAPVRESLNSALRHIAEAIDNKDIDEETKRHHMAHAAVNAMFVFCTLRDAPKHDDRFKK